MRYQKELSVAAIAIVILLMIFKPSVLGIVYNNVLGKLFLVACIVFLTLKHTIAGLLGVVFIAVIASNSVFEGIENEKDENKNDETAQKDENKKDKTIPAVAVAAPATHPAGADAASLAEAVMKQMTATPTA
jgi:hypothetical protein